MKAVSLPARIGYTAVALPLGYAAGFYSCMQVLPQFSADHPKLQMGDGAEIFKIAIFVGISVAFTVGLVVLTLPWIRHRKRRGRGWRIALSATVVVVLSAAFTVEGGYGLICDLALAAWLTYTLAFTFVRYGLVDQARRSSTSAKGYY